MTPCIEPLPLNPRIGQLIAGCDLPIADLPFAESLQFFGHCAGSELLGVVGLELYPPAALLRSLAVAPGHRGVGLGRALVAFAEVQAAAQGATSLFLLTTSVGPFFAGLGYRDVPRESAPAAIRATAQFSGLCPASARFMGKEVWSLKRNGV